MCDKVFSFPWTFFAPELLAVLESPIKLPLLSWICFCFFEQIVRKLSRVKRFFMFVLFLFALHTFYGISIQPTMNCKKIYMKETFCNIFCQQTVWLWTPSTCTFLIIQSSMKMSAIILSRTLEQHKIFIYIQPSEAVFKITRFLQKLQGIRHSLL
jgi:hypothetical protein